MMHFFDRSRELDFLESKYKELDAQLIVLYGRRRIGKTDLITKFCEDKEHVYFLGRLESKDDTIRRLNEILIAHFKDTSLIRYPVHGWEEFLDYMGKHGAQRLILAIDEFPFIIDRFPGIVSLLQDKWDNLLKQTRIMMILSGSSIGMMEQHELDYKSPLYGRRTGQWKLDKMDIVHLNLFFPRYQIEDIFKVYACIDTIPGYLARFDPTRTVLDNIQARIFSKGEYLYEEVEILLREEFRDPSNYMSIISAIASGINKMNEINNFTGLDKSLLSKYLHVLERVGIIERVLPVTAGFKAALKKKGALYEIKDNFIDFWFRFVYVNKDELERGNTRSVLENAAAWDNYLGRKFERFVLEALRYLQLGTFTRAGRWWYKDVEVDILALEESSETLLAGECKWEDGVDAASIARGLDKKLPFISWHDGTRKEMLAIFARSFSRTTTSINGKPVRCIDLDKMASMLCPARP